MKRLTAPPSRFAFIGVILATVVLGLWAVFSSHAATVTSGWVTRSGNSLMLGGQPFRFAGANAYWVGLDDNIRDSSGAPTYPTHYRIDNGFAAAQAIGSTVVRAHTLGVSVGCAKCLEPSLGTFNEAAFESMDYAVKSAQTYNIKLMVPLIDQWRWYHGGKSVFTGWRGYVNNPDAGQNVGNNQTQKASEANFYTDQTVIADYKNYLNHLLNHVNQYTGVAYKDDPTIAIWETGNEIFDAPPPWTDMIATYLKQGQGVKQLIADGSAAAGKTVAEAALSSASIDIVGGHYYNWPNGLNVDTLTQQASLAASAKKVYIIGEYGWTLPGADTFQRAIESNPNIAGDMFWSVIPHDADGSTVTHGSGWGSDDVAFYVPTTNAAMQTSYLGFARHAAAMSGAPAVPTPTLPPTPSPTPLPTPIPGAVNDTSFVYTGGWQTSTGAEKYQGDDHYSTAGGDSFSYSFTGSQVKLIASKAPHHGIMAVSIDGGPETMVDAYAAVRVDQQLLYTSAALAAGSHTLHVRNTGTKNMASSSTVINADRADILTGTPIATPSPKPSAIPSSTPAPTVVQGDLNGDGHLNALDLSYLLTKWGSSDGTADITHDGAVNILDLSILLTHWTG